jgi:hypothetical protein
MIMIKPTVVDATLEMMHFYIYSKCYIEILHYILPFNL